MKFINDEKDTTVHTHFNRYLNKEIQFTTPKWYLHSLNEIFNSNNYIFKCDVDNPTILDLGANLGLSTLFFKKQYPKSKIISWEPDPTVFKCLYNNCKDLNGVTLYNKGIYKEDCVLNFCSEKSLGGSIQDIRSTNNDVIKIECEKLNPYLNEKIHLLKIDIEGAENDVLESIRYDLNNVEKIFIEYHGFPNKEQNLNNILTILKENNFRYYITEGWKNMDIPFVEYDNKNMLFDLQLNIFAYKIN